MNLMNRLFGKRRFGKSEKKDAESLTANVPKSSTDGWDTQDRQNQYTAWTLAHLPQGIPKAALDKAVQSGDWSYFDGLNVMELNDRGPALTVYQATDEEDLKLWWFQHLSKDISMQWELLARKENNQKWRYLRAKVENGRWLYIEQKKYRYNAIEDTRLDWFEKHLMMLKPVFPLADWNKKVEEYIRLMNTWFKNPHWDYDRDRLCFIEISDAKEHNTDGIEEPRPGSIIRIVN